MDLSFSKPSAHRLAVFLSILISSTTPKASADTSSALPLKYEQPISITGVVRDPATTNVLFKFKRVATRSGSRLNVARDFVYPDGKLAAKETVVYEGDNLVSLTLEETQIGAKGSAKIVYDKSDPRSSKIEFEYQTAKGKLQTATERLRPNTLSSDMVAPFLIDHWDDLMNNKKVECRFIVISRKETVGFTFTREAATNFGNKPMVIIRMEASSWVVSRFTDPLHFTMERDGAHRILQYVGQTTPKIKVKNEWKDFDALTTFDWD